MEGSLAVSLVVTTPPNKAVRIETGPVVPLEKVLLAEQPKAVLVGENLPAENITDQEQEDFIHRIEQHYVNKFEALQLNSQEYVQECFAALKILTEYFGINAETREEIDFSKLQQELAGISRNDHLELGAKKFLSDLSERILVFLDFNKSSQAETDQSAFARFCRLKSLQDSAVYFKDAFELCDQMNLKRAVAEAQLKRAEALVERVEVHVPIPPVYAGRVDKDPSKGNDLYITSLGQGYQDQATDLKEAELSLEDFDSCTVRTVDEIDVREFPLSASNWIVPTVLGYRCSAISILDKDGNKLSAADLKIYQNTLGICSLDKLPQGASQINYRLTKFEPSLEDFFSAHSYCYRRPADSLYDNWISASPILQDKLAGLGAKLSSWNPVYSKHPALTTIFLSAARKGIFYDVMSALGMIGKCDQLAELVANEIKLLGVNAVTATGFTLEKNPKTEEISFRLSEQHAKALVHDSSTNRYESIEATSFANSRNIIDNDRLSADRNHVLDLIDQCNPNSEDELIALCRELDLRAQTWRRALKDGEINPDAGINFLSEASSLDRCLHSLGSRALVGNEFQTYNQRNQYLDLTLDKINSHIEALREIQLISRDGIEKALDILDDINQEKTRKVHSFLRGFGLSLGAIDLAKTRRNIIKQMQALLARPEKADLCKQLIIEAVNKESRLEILSKCIPVELFHSIALPEAEKKGQRYLRKYCQKYDCKILRELMLQNLESSPRKELYINLIASSWYIYSDETTIPQLIRIIKVLNKTNIDLGQVVAAGLMATNGDPKRSIEFLQGIYADETIRNTGLIARNPETGKYQLAASCFEFPSFIESTDKDSLYDLIRKARLTLEDPLAHLLAYIGLSAGDSRWDRYDKLESIIDLPETPQISPLSFSDYSTSDQEAIIENFRLDCRYLDTLDLLPYIINDLDISDHNTHNALRAIIEKNPRVGHKKIFLDKLINSIPGAKEILLQAIGENDLDLIVFNNRYTYDDRLAAGLFGYLLKKDPPALEAVKAFCTNHTIAELKSSDDLCQVLRANYQGSSNWSHIDHYWKQGLSLDARELVLHELMSTRYARYDLSLSVPMLRNCEIENAYRNINWSEDDRSLLLQSLVDIAREQLSRAGLYEDRLEPELIQAVILAQNSSSPGDYTEFLRSLPVLPSIGRSSEGLSLRSKLLQTKAPSLWVDCLQRNILYSSTSGTNEQHSWQNHYQGLGLVHINTCDSAKLVIERLFQSNSTQWQGLIRKPPTLLDGFANYSRRVSANSEGDFYEHRELRAADAAGCKLDWKATSRCPRAESVIVQVMQSQEEKKNKAFIVDLDWLASKEGQILEGSVNPEVETLVKVIYEQLKSPSQSELNLHFTCKGQVFASYDKERLQKIFFDKSYVQDQYPERTRLVDFIIEMQDLSNYVHELRGSSDRKHTIPIILDHNIQVGSTRKDKAYNIYVFAEDSLRLHHSQQMFENLIRRGHSVNLIKAPSVLTIVK